MGEPLVLLAQEAADLLRVSKSHVYELIKRGDLPTCTFLGDRTKRIPRQAVLDLIERSTSTAAAPPSAATATAGQPSAGGGTGAAEPSEGGSREEPADPERRTTGAASAARSIGRHPSAGRATPAGTVGRGAAGGSHN